MILHQGVDIAVGAADIDGVVGDGRRGKNGTDGHQFLDADDHVVIEKVGECSLVVGGAVGLEIDRAIFLEIIRFEGPGDFLRLEIDGEQLALMGANVQGAASNCR